MNEFNVYTSILKLLEPLTQEARTRVVDAIVAEIVSRGTQVATRAKLPPNVPPPPGGGPRIDVVGVAEAARIAGVTRQAIYMAIKRGKLKPGSTSKRGEVRIARADVLATYHKRDRQYAVERARAFVEMMRSGKRKRRL